MLIIVILTLSLLIIILLADKSLQEPAPATLRCTNDEWRHLTSEVFINETNSVLLANSLVDFRRKCRELTHSSYGGDKSSSSSSLTKRSLVLNDLIQEFENPSSSSSAAAASSHSNITVFIYDFKLVSGDVYIDFSQSRPFAAPTLLNNGPPPSHLIINLVARQFLTFNLLNLPTNLTLTILLNGECTLQTTSSPLVRVLHSPAYDDHSLLVDSSPSNSINSRLKWISYLSKHVQARFHFYVEHLTMLCHVKHLHVDLARGFAQPLIQFTDYNFYLDKDYLIIKKCSTINTNNPRPKKSFSVKLVQEFYVFEFDANANSSSRVNANHHPHHNRLRLFLKDCDGIRKYNIAFFFRRWNKTTDSNPIIILHFDSTCQLSILYVIKQS